MHRYKIKKNNSSDTNIVNRLFCLHSKLRSQGIIRMEQSQNEGNYPFIFEKSVNQTFILTFEKSVLKS